MTHNREDSLDDLLPEVQAGIDSMMTFTPEDVEYVIDNVWAKLHVLPGFEKQAEIELKPLIRQTVLGTTIHIGVDGTSGPKFSSSLAEDGFRRLNIGSTWHSSVDMLAELERLYR